MHGIEKICWIQLSSLAGGWRAKKTRMYRVTRLVTSKLVQECRLEKEMPCSLCLSWVILTSWLLQTVGWTMLNWKKLKVGNKWSGKEKGSVEQNHHPLWRLLSTAFNVTHKHHQAYQQSGWKRATSIVIALWNIFSMTRHVAFHFIPIGLILQLINT